MTEHDETRMGTWTHERDGDLNPSLLLWTIAGVANIAVSVCAMVLAFQNPKQAVPLMAIASLNGVSALVCFGIGWLSIARAKILANSAVLREAQKALGQFAGFDRDERDEEQIAAMEREASTGRR